MNINCKPGERANEEWRRNCDRTMMSAPRSISACSRPAQSASSACLAVIYPSPFPPFLPVPCFALPFSGYLSDTFILCQTKLSSAKQRQLGKGSSGEGGKRDETPCSLMHTCGLVLSPFYILDENMRKLSLACVYIGNVLPHVIVSHTLNATPPPPPPPPPRKKQT